ncbi:hypothetical protein GCM10010413_12880 [Promicromonospora sukumoe]|uniref:Uncharacterized protein n=1 Tax=Promicromonospora sukumoe TaxID=88382 RepID=A0A7W3J644_9MICO|nr:hypothetical protein [Promicromonospora sukumoe]MBA8806947.1 hypothetical protein [Promicromonospora sukumoe]
MDQILEFLAAHMSYLWRDARFRITDSDVTTSNGGNSTVVIESKILRIRLETDRRQLFLDFQPVRTNRPRDWYSVEIVRRYFFGEPDVPSMVDASIAEFIGDNLDDIESRFSPEQWESTRESLKELERKRSKKMWG